MNLKNWQLKTFTSPIMLAFFMLLGYLEAGYLGLFAGMVLYGIAIITILISLVPFIGVYLWYNGYIFLANYLLMYIPIFNTIYLVTWVMMFIAIVITILTSALVVTGIGLFLYYRKPKKKLSTGINVIDSLIQKIPSSFFKGIDVGNLTNIFNKIFEELSKIWDKIDQKIVGSALVFLGIGISSHDFWWENTEWNPETSRPTHGAYEGLQLSILGIQIIVSDKPLITQMKLCLLSYLGVVLCYVGFFLMQFIPKGISRIVNHIFWWAGTALIIYNWYILIQPYINKEKP